MRSPYNRADATLASDKAKQFREMQSKYRAATYLAFFSAIGIVVSYPYPVQFMVLWFFFAIGLYWQWSIRRYLLDRKGLTRADQRSKHWAASWMDWYAGVPDRRAGLSSKDIDNKPPGYTG